MRLFPVLVLGLFLSACGDEGSDLVGPALGSLEITTTTSGEAGSDGYTVSVDGGTPEPIGLNATVLRPEIAVGAHVVQLAGMAPGCTVEGQNPRGTSVTAGSTTTVAFAVSCTPEAGAIQVITATTGPAPASYELLLDGASQGTVEPAGARTLGAIPAGAHSVALSALPANCLVQGDNPQTAPVTAGSTVDITFAVECTAPAPPIAFTSNGPGLLAVFLVNPDGSGLRELTEGMAPVWSPDRRRILFSDSDLFVINADGSGRAALITGEYAVSQYRWSPNGDMIAVVIARLAGEDVFEDLWVLRSDGSGRLRLATNANSPSWSPTGGRLAYVDVTSVSDVHVRHIKVDGTESTRLTSPGVAAFQPAWSPMDARIAFVTLGDKDLFLINPDGTGLSNLTQGQGDDEGPAWSPDGSRIAFTTSSPAEPLESEIAVMDSDGGNRRILTDRAGFDVTPSWSPDGGNIVFHGSESNDSEIFVMAAGDGSGMRNVSNRPETLESTPNWAGGGAGASMRANASALRMKLRR